MPYPNALAGLFGLPDNNAQPDTSGGLFGAAKRQVTGLLSDPVGNAKQTLGLLGQQISRQNALMDTAFADPTNPLQITNRNALAEAANNMLTGPLGFAPVGMVVYHGSPHAFDKFDSKKIGTGEGNQAYGYGTYVAESPEVAKRYAQNGNVYKVDVPDETVAKMLDWDKPMSQQPESVKKAFNLSKHGPESPIHNMTGAHAYVLYGKRFGNPTSSAPQTAAAFAQLGIPGVRYLDGASRAAGKGTANYVVFPGNEGLLSILSRESQ